ncbi:MAG: energy-coupling factor transporter transmembrane protein EcfT [Anaerolineae bacterium]|nr:energy-coupling factor transporter transmembrane protein EcfT [Anaerolineae bacterium]
MVAFDPFGPGGRDSFFRRLDFRPKLGLLVVATFLAFLWDSPAATGALAAAVVGLCLLAGIRGDYLRRMALIMLPFFALVLLTHGFLNTYVGRTALWAAPAGWPLVGGWLRLTTEGLLYGLMVIFRTVTLVLVIPLVVFTTELDELVVGLVRLRVPYKVAFVLASTLRFVPLLLEEVQGIVEAQRLRGLEMERMGVVQRVRVYSRIAVPLILGALVRSQQIEVVLASRAFSGSPRRTYLHTTKLRAADYAVLAATLVVAVAAVLGRALWGVGRFPGLA